MRGDVHNIPTISFLISNSIMHIYILLAVVFASLVVLIPIGITILVSGKNLKRNLSELSLKALAIGWLVLFVMFVIAFSLVMSLSAKDNGILKELIILAIVVSVSPTYAYFIEPIVQCSRRKSIDRYTFVEDYKVVETNKPRANAYATGILPFSKTIIVGKGIDEYLNEQEQRALIYHEIYHHKANHMLKFYLITMVIYVTAACVWSWYLRKLPGNEYLHIALFYGGVAGVYQIVQGLVQRRFEKQADLYSVQQMGSYAQISALRKLYALSGTPENQKAINYPTLAQRERYVREKAPGLPD